jgi:hypothetical protein
MLSSEYLCDAPLSCSTYFGVRRQEQTIASGITPPSGTNPKHMSVLRWQGLVALVEDIRLMTPSESKLGSAHFKQVYLVCPPSDAQRLCQQTSLLPATSRQHNDVLASSSIVILPR